MLSFPVTMQQAAGGRSHLKEPTMSTPASSLQVLRNLWAEFSLHRGIQRRCSAGTPAGPFCTHGAQVKGRTPEHTAPSPWTGRRCRRCGRTPSAGRSRPTCPPRRGPGTGDQRGSAVSSWSERWMSLLLPAAEPHGRYHSESMFTIKAFNQTCRFAAWYMPGVLSLPAIHRLPSPHGPSHSRH